MVVGHYEVWHAGESKGEESETIAGFPIWVAPHHCLLLFSHLQFYIHLLYPMTTFEENNLKKQTSLGMNYRNIFGPQFYSL